MARRLSPIPCLSNANIQPFTIQPSGYVIGDLRGDLTFDQPTVMHSALHGARIPANAGMTGPC